MTVELAAGAAPLGPAIHSPYSRPASRCPAAPMAARRGARVDAVVESEQRELVVFGAGVGERQLGETRRGRGRAFEAEVVGDELQRLAGRGDLVRGIGGGIGRDRVSGAAAGVASVSSPDAPQPAMARRIAARTAARLEARAGRMAPTPGSNAVECSFAVSNPGVPY